MVANTHYLLVGWKKNIKLNEEAMIAYFIATDQSYYVIEGLPKMPEYDDYMNRITPVTFEEYEASDYFEATEDMFLQEVNPNGD